MEEVTILSPVNSFEAESRRINRYWDFNHSQGEVETYEPSISGEANTLFTVEATRTLTNTKGSKKLLLKRCQKTKSTHIH